MIGFVLKVNGKTKKLLEFVAFFYSIYVEHPVSVANSWQMFSAKSTKKFGRTQYPCIKAVFCLKISGQKVTKMLNL
jgi:hypothetical protein